MNRLEIVRNVLKSRLAEGVKYKFLADDLKTSKGAIWKFINTSYVPKDLALRRRLLKLAPSIAPHRNWKKKYAYLAKWVRKQHG